MDPMGLAAAAAVNFDAGLAAEAGWGCRALVPAAGLEPTRPLPAKGF